MNGIANKTGILKLIYFVIILAGSLRIYRLSYQSLWLDEVLNVNWSKLPSISHIIHTLSTGDNSPPFYYIFLHFWMKLGSSEFMIRLPSAIAGVITVFLIFKIAEALFDRTIGLISAFLSATSPFYLWVSQEARMYAFLAMFGLFSFYFFIRAIKENRVELWIGYSIFSLLALYTHYYAFFTLFAQLIYFIVNRKDFKHLFKKFVFSTGAIILFFLPCLFLLIQQFLVSDRRHKGFFPPTIWAIPHTFFDLSTGYSLLQIELSNFFENIYYNSTIILFSAIIFIPIFISGLNHIIQKQKNAILILYYFLVPLILSYIISLKVHIFGSKYLAAASAGYFIILAVGLKNIKQKWVLSALTFGLLIVNGVSISNYYFNDNFAKGGWREAAKFIEENEKPGDIILFPLPSPADAFEYYYRGNIPTLGIIPNKKYIMPNIEFICKPYKRAWYMPDLQKIFDPNNLAKKWLLDKGKIERENKFKSVTVVSYILN